MSVEISHKIEEINSDAFEDNFDIDKPIDISKLDFSENDTEKSKDTEEFDIDEPIDVSKLDFSENDTEKSKNTEEFDIDEPIDVSHQQDSNSSDVRKIDCNNQKYEGKKHPVTDVPFEKKIVDVDGEKVEVVVPVFDSVFDAQLPENMYKDTDSAQETQCNAQLKEAVENDEQLRSKFTEEQLEQIADGETPDDYTWHHDAEVGKMQLVDTETHRKTGHTGGRNIWGGGTTNRK